MTGQAQPGEPRGGSPADGQAPAGGDPPPPGTAPGDPPPPGTAPGDPRPGPVLALVGPTASGKTALALELAPLGVRLVPILL